MMYHIKRWGNKYV